MHVRENIVDMRMGLVEKVQRQYLWIWPRPDTERKTADGIWHYIGSRLAFPPSDESHRVPAER